MRDSTTLYFIPYFNRKLFALATLVTVPFWEIEDGSPSTNSFEMGISDLAVVLERLIPGNICMAHSPDPVEQEDLWTKAPVCIKHNTKKKKKKDTNTRDMFFEYFLCFPSTEI